MSRSKLKQWFLPIRRDSTFNSISLQRIIFVIEIMYLGKPCTACGNFLR